MHRHCSPPGRGSSQAHGGELNHHAITRIPRYSPEPVRPSNQRFLQSRRLVRCAVVYALLPLKAPKALWILLQRISTERLRGEHWCTARDMPGCMQCLLLRLAVALLSLQGTCGFLLTQTHSHQSAPVHRTSTLSQHQSSTNTYIQTQQHSTTRQRRPRWLQTHETNRAAAAHDRAQTRYMQHTVTMTCLGLFKRQTAVQRNDAATVHALLWGVHTHPPALQW